MDYKILHTFQMAWVGWECDSECAIVEDDNGQRYLTTNFSERNFLKFTGLQTHEKSIKMLNDKIAEYKSLIVDTEKALGILTKG